MDPTIAETSTTPDVPRLQRDVQNAIRAELWSAQDRFGSFNSAHEGYAVVLEEADELDDEHEQIPDALRRLWSAVKANDPDDARACAQWLCLIARNAAAEAVQLAAMAERFLIDVQAES